MKPIAFIFVALFCASVFASDNLDSILQAQRVRAGNRADTLFAVLDSGKGEIYDPNYAIFSSDESYNLSHKLTVEEIADMRFLLTYLPLSDIAVMTGNELLADIYLARKTRTEFSWGAQVSDKMFRNFVLPHRVTQEPFVYQPWSWWRKEFHDDIAPRVKNLSMTEAALEVNHWCHEKATYQPSDGRDQDPLTTIRAGLGRCEEEMILAICALRSVGIPARQCYTPYWPHTDDNHAWVEVWTDGQWHYFGACEPDVALDRAWFTDAAARTMLVVSTSYGKYEGDEPVLREVGKTTLINSTAVYGKTHTVHVKLEDHKGKPLPKQPVVFSLFNYGAIVPAISLETDQKGEVSLVCGLGDWFVSAGKGEWAAFKHITSADTSVILRVDKQDAMRGMTEVAYTPPPEAPPKENSGQDSLFACRITNEDTLRDSLWGTWARELGLSDDFRRLKPDSLKIFQVAQQCSLDGAKVYDLLLKARGNWGNLYRYLFRNFPYHASPEYEIWRLRNRWDLLEQLTEKDARDFSSQVLGDHEIPEAWSQFLHRGDSTSQDRFKNYVIAPRIDKESSRAWRRALVDFLTRKKPTKSRGNRWIERGVVRGNGSFNEKLSKSRGDKAMLKWLCKNIKIDKDRDRLGPPLTPAECLELRRGTVDDIERLYVGLCRVREIPARFDPVSNRLQRWEDNAWLSVDLGIREKRKESSTATGFLTLLPADSDSATLNARCNREWAVQRWDKDHFTDLDFGFETAFKDQIWPQELPVGLYCLTSGVRRRDGSVPLKLEWFEIKKGSQVQASLAVK